MSDHRRVAIQESVASCGICTMSGFSSDASVKDIVFQLASSLYHPAKGRPYEFVIWSDTAKSKGSDVAKYLGEYENTLTESDWAENSKTGNQIKVFVWQIPHAEFRAWYGKQRISRIKANA